jgi:hypothetical protein
MLYKSLYLSSVGYIYCSLSYGVKAASCLGLTTLPPSCADCLEILEASTSWSPKGPLQACIGIAEPSTFTVSLHSYLQQWCTIQICLGKLKEIREDWNQTDCINHCLRMCDVRFGSYLNKFSSCIFLIYLSNFSTCLCLNACCLFKRPKHVASSRNTKLLLTVCTYLLLRFAF